MGALNLQVKVKIFLNDAEWQYKSTDVSALLPSNTFEEGSNAETSVDLYCH